MLTVTLALLLAAPPLTAADAGKSAMKHADLDMNAATARRDLPAFLSFLADDVTFFGSRAPAQGHEGVRAAWAPFFAAGGPTLVWHPTQAEVADSGDLGFTVGDAVFTATGPDGKPKSEPTHYVTVWRKQASGGWRVEVDFGNQGPPPATALTTLREGASRDGSLKYTVSSFSRPDLPDKGDAPRYGQVLVISKRDASGAMTPVLRVFHPTRPPA